MIQPNASRDELDSPFYLNHEKICQKWEELALKNGGTIIGTYNSWSFKVYMKNDDLPPWKIIVSRANYTGGMLIFSSKYQSLVDQIKVEVIVKSDANFTIKKRSILDLFSRQKRSSLKMNKSYNVLGANENSTFTEVIRLLTPVFKKKRVRRVHLKNNSLVISLIDSNEEYEIVQSLIDFQLK